MVDRILAIVAWQIRRTTVPFTKKLGAVWRGTLSVLLAQDQYASACDALGQPPPVLWCADPWLCNVWLPAQAPLTLTDADMGTRLRSLLRQAPFSPHGLAHLVLDSEHPPSALA
jgi:hypothetical protein